MLPVRRYSCNTELTADSGSGQRHDPSAYVCKKCKLRLVVIVSIMKNGSHVIKALDRKGNSIKSGKIEPLTRRVYTRSFKV